MTINLQMAEFINFDRLSIAPLIVCTTLAISACAQSPAKQTSSQTCTHEEALEMGSILHEELDVGSERFRANMSDEQRRTFNKAVIELIDASSLLLKGEDDQACKIYRRIAKEQNVSLK